MKQYILSFIFFLSICSDTLLSQQYSWRYYNTGNTGIQGDYVEAVWIDHDGDPYIAGYTPGWEEGGFAKLIQSENRWINYSNVDYPVIGSINDVGSSRISDIEEDANGILWMATWRGLLKFNPAIGGNSLEFWGANNSIHPGGRSRDLAIAPDGSVWIAVISVTWGEGGLVNYNPNTNVWRYWGYGTTANNWPPLIPFLINVSIQVKPNGGYLVWASYESIVVVFDSDAQLFTQLPNNGNPGDVLKLPGNDCVDDLQNLWAIRIASPGIYSLDYKTQTGNWVTPTQPPVTSLINDIWSFKAYGNNQALLIDGNSIVWKFNGTSWQNLGAWKDGAFSYGIDIDENGNIWATGVGGAAKRNAQTGTWQRYRITNSSQIDYFVDDISIDDQGNVWMTGNAGPGYGGFQKFDGTRWIGFNQYTYGLGYPFPFPADNTEAIYYRPSNGTVVINPLFGYLHSWNGSNYTSLNYPNDRSEGLVEDSQGRLWSLGEYYNLKYYNDVNNSWTSVPFDGWGYRICKDPSRPGTIWASSGFQALRTDGSYNFTRYNTDFPELDPQSDLLTTMAAGLNGVAWVGSNKGLFKLNAELGTYQFYSPSNSLIPGDNISPFAVSPDGRVWFTNFQSTNTSTYGLCWFDGTNFGIFPQQQTGGLPHAQIYDIEVKNIQNGYELWISAVSRGIAVLTVETSPITTFQLTVNVANGWNMVSIPGLHPTNQNVNTWWAFRDPGANVFKYAGGYQTVTDAVPGTGYWMKHSGARAYNTGDEWPAGGIQIVPHAQLTAASGWNLFGGYELVVTAANVTTNPPGLQSGPIYAYSGGYQVATTLNPGYGYWIKLNAAGQIIIPETLTKGGKPVEYFVEDWGKIILTDATGISYTLYAVKGQVDLSQYDLPPAPPAGMFDIRFSSGRIAEDINSSIKAIDMNGITYPIKVRVEGMDIRLMDESGKMLNTNLKSGEDVVISDATIQKLMVSGELIPAEYALEQNYPNPFNPGTMIEFSLPEDVANVKLSIYNALGEKVAELVNTSLTAGKYSYQWNAQNVATGMYIYELRTDKFVSVKKMILLK